MRFTRHLIALCILLILCAAITPSSSALLYVAGDGGQFGTLDPLTGNYASIGTTNVNLFGLGFDAGGTLYGLDTLGDLHQVDTTTAALTLIGSTGLTTSSIGATSDGTLYAMTFENPSNLYRLNPSTVAATLVGNTGFASIGGINGDDSGNLYATTGTDQNFYKVDPTTGAGTLLGTATYGEVFALAFTDSTMFALNIAGEIHSVDLSNGMSSFVSNYDTNQAGLIGAAARVARLQVIPEPTPLVLLTVGLLGLAVLKRRKAKGEGRN